MTAATDSSTGSCCQARANCKSMLPDRNRYSDQQQPVSLRQEHGCNPTQTCPLYIQTGGCRPHSVLRCASAQWHDLVHAMHFAFKHETHLHRCKNHIYIYIYIYIYVCVCTLNARCAMSRASISRNGTCRIGCRAVPTVACMITHGCCVVMRTPRCHLWATWSAFCTKRHARSRSARANVPHDAGNCTCDSVRINRGLASCGRLSTQARGQGWLPACASAGRRQQAPH